MENTKIFAEMTIAEKFAAIINGDVKVSDSEVLEFLKDRMEKSKKNGGSSKPTKAQIEMKEVTMPKVLSALAEFDRPVTVSELAKILDFSQSKVTSTLTKLREAGKVTREEVKGKPFYALA